MQSEKRKIRRSEFFRSECHSTVVIPSPDGFLAGRGISLKVLLWCFRALEENRRRDEGVTFSPGLRSPANQWRARAGALLVLSGSEGRLCEQGLLPKGCGACGRSC